MKTERLQKVLSRAGVTSRRKAEELIVAGRVRVGGRIVTELGTRVDPEHDRIEVDGRRIVEEDRVYIVLHKPREVMCTMSDPEGRRTVAELVEGVGARVVPVGRLDYHTSGALLLTNDGDFAAVIGHPSKGAPKTYVAKVLGVVDDKGLARWRQSIEIDGRRTQPAEVSLLRVEGNKTWLEVILREGRNRHIRRLGEVAGNMVMRLSRQSVAGIGVEDLAPGQWRYLTADELVALRNAYGVPTRVRGVEVSPGVHGRAERRGASRSPRDAKGAPAGERARWDDRGPGREERAARGPWRDERGPGREERGARGPWRDERGPGREERGARGPRRDDRGPGREERGARGPRRDDRGPGREERGARGPRRDDRGPGREERGARGSRRDDRGPGREERGARGPRRDDRGPGREERGARGPRHDERGSRGGKGRNGSGERPGVKRPKRGPSTGRGRG